MNCELLNGLIGGLMASLVTVGLYFIDRYNKRRDLVKPEKIQMIKELSLHVEKIRQLTFVVNMYLDNIDFLDNKILGITKAKFIEELVAIDKLTKEHPYLLDKKYLSAISNLKGAVISMHNYPSDEPSIGRTEADGRKIYSDLIYQLSLVEGQFRYILGTD